MKKPVKSKNHIKSQDINIPDRHFRHTEPESDYSMDELDHAVNTTEWPEDPDIELGRKTQDDDE